jgi:uncharacterized protein (DUF983 family)
VGFRVLREKRLRCLVVLRLRLLRAFACPLDPPTDTPTFFTVTVVVIVVVALACWRPARRASRVDPVVVLRQDWLVA